MAKYTLRMPNGKYPGQYLADHWAKNYNAPISELVDAGEYLLSATKMAIYRQFNGVDLVVKGMKLRYNEDNGVLNGGMITKIILRDMDTGAVISTVSGLKMPGHEFYNTVRLGDAFATAKAILKGKDFVVGTAKNDKLLSYGAADRLEGQAGDDLLDGGAGNDILHAGAGSDELYGGTGADTFVFKRVSESKLSDRDMIYDFSRGSRDKIDLSSIDADTTKAGNQKFDFIGEKSFTKSAGELRYDGAKGDSYINADVNGDGRSDFSVRFDKVIDFLKGDFLL